MAGYANRVITLNFEELSEPGDLVHVVMKNPRLVPLDELTASDVPTGANGEPDVTQMTEASYGILAPLVKAWHVYDATDDSDDQRPLPLPATPASVRKLPMEIQQAMIKAITDVVNPS